MSNTASRAVPGSLSGAFLQARASRTTKQSLQTVRRQSSNQISNKQAQGTQTEKRKRKTFTKARSVVRQSRETILAPVDKLRPEQLTARCSASHEGRKVLQERIPMRVDILFNLMFCPSTFMAGFHERRKNTDLCMGTWRRNAKGQDERTVTVTVALQGNIGPKNAKVIETQVMRECSQAGQLYSIDCETENEDIPYADTFVVEVHYCLKATVEQHTDVQVFGKIKFLKPVWAVVKSFIEKNAYSGLEEFCQSLYCALLNEIKKL